MFLRSLCPNFGLRIVWDVKIFPKSVFSRVFSPEDFFNLHRSEEFYNVSIFSSYSLQIKYDTWSPTNMTHTLD